MHELKEGSEVAFACEGGAAGLRFNRFLMRLGLSKYFLVLFSLFFFMLFPDLVKQV
jgi:hypothetical protein